MKALIALLLLASTAHAEILHIRFEHLGKRESINVKIPDQSDDIRFDLLEIQQHPRTGVTLHFGFSRLINESWTHEGVPVLFQGSPLRSDYKIISMRVSGR